MPAVTVSDRPSLPRVSAIDPSSGLKRQVASLATAPSGLEGGRSPVRRAFAGLTFAGPGPFMHLDQVGEVGYAPGSRRAAPDTERKSS